MKLRTAFALIVLILAAASIAVAGSYGFTVAAPMKAGSVDLAVGDYKVAVQGSVAIVTSLKTYKSFTMMVKTETVETKFATTSVDTTRKDGQSTLRAIEVGGSTTKLVFE